MEQHDHPRNGVGGGSSAAAVPAATGTVEPTAAAPRLATPATVVVEGLVVYAHHGINAEEQAVGQRFEFDVEVDVEDCGACRSDRADDAVAYETIAAIVVEVATTFRFRLVEALAEAVCMELLAELDVSMVRLGITKTSPAIPHAVSRAGIRIARSRAHLEARDA